MQNKKIFTPEEIEAIRELLKHELQEALRPANETILDD